MPDPAREPRSIELFERWRSAEWAAMAAERAAAAADRAAIAAEHKSAVAHEALEKALGAIHDLKGDRS
jgi:hypothetical protein